MDPSRGLYRHEHDLHRAADHAGLKLPGGLGASGHPGAEHDLHALGRAPHPSERLRALRLVHENVQETYDYNNRMQPMRLQLGTSSNNSYYNCMVYDYYGVSPASCTGTPAQNSTGNNGNAMTYWLAGAERSSAIL